MTKAPNLYMMLRDARRSHCEGDEEAAKASLRAYYEARMAGELAPAISGDVAALDLVRAISDAARCFERHVVAAGPPSGDAEAAGFVVSAGPARVAADAEALS
jgi:hypothetical protein